MINIILFTSIFNVIMIAVGILKRILYRHEIAIMIALFVLGVALTATTGHPLYLIISFILQTIALIISALVDEESELIFCYPVTMSIEELTNLGITAEIGKYKGKLVIVARTVDENLRLRADFARFGIEVEQKIVPAWQVKKVK